MTAIFEAVPQAVLQSSIPGMKISSGWRRLCRALPPGSPCWDRFERCGAERNSDQRNFAL